jgi:hypothetical protein
MTAEDRPRLVIQPPFASRCAGRRLISQTGLYRKNPESASGAAGFSQDDHALLGPVNRHQHPAEGAGVDRNE